MALGYSASGRMRPQGMALKRSAPAKMLWKSGRKKKKCKVQDGSRNMPRKRMDLELELESVSRRRSGVSKIEEEKGDRLMEVIKLQKMQGFWQFTPAILSYIGLSEAKAKSSLPADIPDLETWVTILVMIWLEDKEGATRSNWRLLHKKAVKWLKNKKIVYADVVGSARKALLV